MNQPANTPDTPWPVGKVNDQVKGWIERLGYLWVGSVDPNQLQAHLEAVLPHAA